MGELGADVVSLRATDQAGAAYDLTLAPGDRVRLFDRLNARFLDGGRGNIGHNGSVLEVRDVTAEGIVLRTAAGRDGLVSWESSALDFMERARDLGRGAAHAMQAGFRRAEAREAAGEPRATLGTQLRERRDGRAVERLRQALEARWQAVRAGRPAAASRWGHSAGPWARGPAAGRGRGQGGA